MTDYYQLLVRMAPEAVLVLTAGLVLASDVMWWQKLDLRFRQGLCAFLSTVGCLIAWVLLAGSTERGVWYDGMWASDSAGVLVKQVLVVLAVATAWIQMERPFTRHVGEYAALMLLATVGGLVLASTRHVLVVFVGLELLSLSLYAMTAFDRSRAAAMEASMKYFLIGSIAAAFMLFGFSLCYGLTGELNLEKMARGLAKHLGDPLAVIALVMVVAGLGFKIAAVPFHLWAPDVYEGAPTPAAAFVAASSKVASFFVLTRVVLVGWEQIGGSVEWGMIRAGWKPLVAGLAVVSMVLGNFVALRQRNLKRLLAYSAVAHAGYVLVGLMAGGEHGGTSVIYYAVTYGVTSLGAFAVVAVLEAQSGEDTGNRVESLAGLWMRSPLLALCFAVFVLSLAGIPPLAGFAGKLYLFIAGVKAGGLWVVWVALLTSAVSLYYYLALLKQVFVVAPVVRAPVRVRWMTGVVIVLLALGVIYYGCAPDVLLRRL